MHAREKLTRESARAPAWRLRSCAKMAALHYRLLLMLQRRKNKTRQKKKNTYKDGGEKEREKSFSFSFSAFEDRRLCWRELFGSQAGELACTEGEGKFDVRDGEAEKKREIAHAPRLFKFVLFFIWIFSYSLVSSIFSFLAESRKLKGALGCVCVLFFSLLLLLPTILSGLGSSR